MIARDGDDLGTEGLLPAALAVAAVFSGFAVYHGFTLSSVARESVFVYDLVLVALAVALYAIFRRRAPSQRGFHVIASVLSGSVLGNLLLTALVHANPLFSHLVSVLLIATIAVIVSPRWAVVQAALELLAWGAVAYVVFPANELVLNVFVMTSSVAVGFVIHAGRHRTRARIIALRADDARRELALQRALAEADEARRGLDRKVEDRTAALRSELEERTRLEEQLRHAQKLEAVGRLAGGIAHDFNNLLTVIRMSHTTLAEAGTPPDEAHDAMRDASDATDRAAALTHDLLAFARKQTLERTTVAVTDVLGGVERMVRRVAEASIRLEVNVLPDIGDILADRHQIEQVLLNLAINAC
ncbi:MAG TPA: histidine kinase dimerization/phospho-acceptor domain-containing protein, partial [Kofleriaceae bacterium]